jgi:hypothetical protein
MNSGKLTARERQVLEHIGRYRLTFQEVVAHLFCEGKSPQKLLDGLRLPRTGSMHTMPDEPLVEVRTGYGGNRRAYKLTVAGTRAARLHIGRAKDLGSESLPTHLAILGFCCMRGERRVLLEKSELAALFGPRTPKGRYHAVAKTPAGNRVIRLSVPAGTTGVSDTVTRVEESLEELGEDPLFKPWLHGGLYAFAVLVETVEHAEALRRAFAKCPVLQRHASAILVEVVPGPTTLEESLDALLATTYTP